ncbi:hypothetical protein [Achromobacter xylosoxidans]|uniref:hypothetical protein n=1 Tax=Alcaligenes xylosoxydans xylosoxydans TaxID=85698 RepID=UPI001EEC9ED7|nr:hypothetical protein [Achromobacter xylosoxidans]
MDLFDAQGHLKESLEVCPEVDCIYLANGHNAGAYPIGLAYYTQEMLTEIFGRPGIVDDDYEFGGELDGPVPW